jgi:lipopolysaccharide export system permease protein
MIWIQICTSHPLFNRPTFLVQRYILREFFPPFLFSALVMGCILTTGFVLFNLMEQSVQFEIPFTLALQIFLARIPEMLFYTLPMASLLGSMLAFSRLSGDGELLSLRMMGWSFYQILGPLCVWGVVIAFSAVLLNETLLPSTAFSARQLLHFAQTQELEFASAQSHIVFKHLDSGQIKYLLYAKLADKKAMKNVVLEIFNQSNLETVLQSQQAYFKDGNWTFSEGKLIQLETGGQSKIVKFSKFRYPLLSSIQRVLEESRLPLEMNLRELAKHIQNLSLSGQGVAALKVRWHQKIALPATTFIFILLGAAMGARTLNSRLQGFGFSLVLIFIYYLFFAIGTALGDSGQIPAWLAAWLADILTGLSMLYLIWSRNRFG